MQPVELERSALCCRSTSDGGELTNSDGQDDLYLKLPSLPSPDTPQQTKEARRGVLVVVATVAANLALTHGLALRHGALPHDAWWGIFALIYAQAAAALLCLAYIQLANPGVVRRSRAACLPVPPEVARRLIEAYHYSSEGISNIHGDDGSSYCVRCLVWRRPAPGRKAHHCSTCGRCVVDFDHHCGVLGRCIAGSGLSGNLWAFYSLLGLSYSGGLTTLGALVGGFSWKYGGTGAGVTLGVCFGLWVLMACFGLGCRVCAHFGPNFCRRRRGVVGRGGGSHAVASSGSSKVLGDLAPV